MKFDICFLTYMARSGSTLLAKELDHYRRTGVTIEDDIPDGILKGEEVYIQNSEELEIFIDKICEGKKFREWKISPEKLFAKLENNYRYPVRLDSLYRSIYDLYFSESNPEIILHKKGRYYLKVDSVKASFPGAKFIHIIRDPRALFNSQKNSKDSITGKPMETSVVAFALNYRNMSEIVRKQADNKSFKVVFYEDFIDKKEEIIVSILDFIQLSDRTKGTSGYFERIPEKQRYLHDNINYDVLSSRKTGWQEELSSLEISILETCLKRELKEYNYVRSNRQPRNFVQYFIKVKMVLLFFIKYLAAKYFPWIYYKLKKIRIQKNDFNNKHINV